MWIVLSRQQVGSQSAGKSSVLETWALVCIRCKSCALTRCQHCWSWLPTAWFRHCNKKASSSSTHSYPHPRPWFPFFDSLHWVGPVPSPRQAFPRLQWYPKRDWTRDLSRRWTEQGHQQTSYTPADIQPECPWLDFGRPARFNQGMSFTLRRALMIETMIEVGRVRRNQWCFDAMSNIASR